MDIQEIFGIEFGKLPYTVKYTSNSDSQALLYVAASVRTHQGARLLGLNVKLDGKLVATPTVWTNEPGVSRPLVAELARIPPARGERTLTLEAMNDATIVDRLDYACGTVLYCGFIEPFVWRFKGPLPQTATFKSQASGIPGVLYFAGSGFMQTPQVCGLSVQLDGVEVARSQIMPSTGNSHFAFPPQFLPVQLKAREYKVSVVPTVAGVSTDQNDTFEVAIFY